MLSNECRKASNRKYNISDKGHKAKKRYKQSEKGMTTRRKYWQSNHYLNYKKEYSKTETYKRLSRKSLAKRRQKLGYIQMFPNPFNDSALVEWHHITDAYVVAIPKDLHRLYIGKNHREKVIDIVKQIYL